MHILDRPSYTADRFARCMARFLAARKNTIFATTRLDQQLASALCMYWERAARKAERI